MQKENSPLAAIKNELQRYRDDSKKYKAVKGWAVRAMAVGLPLKGTRDFLNNDAQNISAQEIRNKIKEIVPQETKRREGEELGPLWSREIMKKAAWSPLPAAQRLAMTDPEYRELFKSGNRITLPFMQGDHIKVYSWLEKQGYTVQDYKEGIAIKIKGLA
jgi:hypothetical protein